MKMSYEPEDDILVIEFNIVRSSGFNRSSAALPPEGGTTNVSR